MRIVGVFGTGTQSRLFESFPKVPGMEIYGPAPSAAQEFPSNLKNFKNVFHPMKSGWMHGNNFKNILNKRGGKIDVLITGFGGDMPKQLNAKYKVALAHGEIGKNIIDLVGTDLTIRGERNYWKGFDLICGGMGTTKKYIQNDIGVNVKFLLNALPQYDLVYRNNNLKPNRKQVFRYLGRKYKETIMFVGFCCRTASWFLSNNEDYFKALRVMIDYAKANPDSLIITKTRKPAKAMEKFLQRHSKEWGGWTKKYYGMIRECAKQPNIHWMDGKIPLYPYFFCDKIVINASSTLETEGVLAAKPVIVFKSKYCPLEDGFNTVKEGAVEFVRTGKELKHALYNYNKIDLEARDRWMKKAKLTFDGLHSQRIVDKLKSL